MKLLLLLGTVIALSYAGEGEYSYDDQEAWGGVCTTGERQSPIDVNEITKTIYYGTGIESFGGDVDVKKVTENLMTVKFEITETEDVIINMPKDWPVGHTKGLQALQLHFHWGQSGAGGSEHKLFGEHYAGEAHLVTRNLDQDDSEAGDYLAVLGIFLETDDQEDNIAEANSNIKSLLEGTSTTLSLDKLFSPETESIFTYEGGLTTPGCDELVFWQVLEKPITISTEVMDMLREVGKEKFEENYRKIQDLNGRHITHRLLHQLYTSPADGGSETCKVDCRAAQQTCMWSMSGSAAAIPSLVLLFIALLYLM